VNLPEGTLRPVILRHACGSPLRTSASHRSRHHLQRAGGSGWQFGRPFRPQVTAPPVYPAASPAANGWSGNEWLGGGARPSPRRLVDASASYRCNVAGNLACWWALDDLLVPRGWRAGDPGGITSRLSLASPPGAGWSSQAMTVGRCGNSHVHWLEPSRSWPA
jgi:hypothetical protein